MAKLFGQYTSYSFVDKDPIIDYVRTVIQDSKMEIKEIAEKSGVNYHTISKWLYGETKRPLAASLNAVLRACQYKLSINSINEPEMIVPTPINPKSKQVKVKTVIHMRKYRNLRKQKG